MLRSFMAGSTALKVSAKLLFTAIGATFSVVGLMAIVDEVHTGYVRFHGIRTVFGDDAVWIGRTCLLLAVLPLTVWLPSRWVGPALALWWVSLMAWIFGPLLFRG
jgi:uncharacterized membrane protein